jgi:hypothetical protein
MRSSFKVIQDISNPMKLDEEKRLKDFVKIAVDTDFKYRSSNNKPE